MPTLSRRSVFCTLAPRKPRNAPFAHGMPRVVRDMPIGVFGRNVYVAPVVTEKVETPVAPDVYALALTEDEHFDRMAELAVCQDAYERGCVL